MYHVHTIMTEELSGGHVLDDSSQGSDNPSVLGEKEKESVGSTQDDSHVEIQTRESAAQGRKRSTPSLAKGTTESCPIKKIKPTRKKVAVKTPVKPTPPTSHLAGRDCLNRPPGESLVEPALSSRRLEKQALVEALCLSVKQTNYHMSRSHSEIPETQSLEF